MVSLYKLLSFAKTKLTRPLNVIVGECISQNLAFNSLIYWRGYMYGISRVKKPCDE